MIKKVNGLILLLVFLFLGPYVWAQKHTIVIYRYNQDSIRRDSFNIPLKKIFLNAAYGEKQNFPHKLLSFEKKKDYSETVYDYTIKDTTCAFIFDGTGHETLVIPGDTLIMNVIGSGSLLHYKKYLLPWFLTLTYEGKNKFVYSLFDSLACVAGEFRFNYIRFKKADTLDLFCEKVKNVYEQQNLFLEQYCTRHNIGARFKELAEIEIHAAYISNLMRAMDGSEGLNTKDFPTPYRDDLVKSGFNDPSIYFKTLMYSTTAYAFTSRVLSPVRLGSNNSDIISLYNTIKQNYTDTIRNHLLIAHLTRYMLNPQMIYPCFDSLITDFKSICKNNVYNHFIDSIFVARKAKGAHVYSLKEAKSSQIIDSKDKVFYIKQLFKTKPLLIICWASWCAPCIREIPSEKKLQKIYGDKVDFVYLSFDRTKKLWLDKLQTLSIKDDKNYLLTNNFTSDLANFYKITSIPIYLLYDKNGMKVEIKDLRPSSDGFKGLLDKLIR